MKSLLVTFSTALCTLLGWHFGISAAVSLPQAALVVVPLESTPKPTLDVSARSVPRSTDVPGIYARLRGDANTATQPEEWAARLYSELQDLPADQFGEAIANIVASGGFEGRVVGQLLAGLWAERDLPAARTWMLGLKDNGNGLDRAIFDTWRQSDPAGMIDWIKTHFAEFGPSSQFEVRYALAKAVVKTDPEEGLRVLATLPSDANGDGRGGLYMEWAKRDPSAATARALQETDEKIRANSLMAIIVRWAWSDPAAARAAAEKFPDPILSERALVGVGKTIANEDASKAVDFLVTIPQTDKSREALNKSIADWSESNPKAALTWAATRDDESIWRLAFAKIAASLPAEKIERAIAALPAEQRTQAMKRWQISRDARNAESK